VETNFEVEFFYPTDLFQYPANWYYTGRHIFNKKYYPMISELESEGEEFECAQAFDRNSSVHCWVRNLSRRDNSFRLPTSTDYFYPDFVALLQDGRTLVVEYKGKP
jgi:type III restriction enzyme